MHIEKNTSFRGAWQRSNLFNVVNKDCRVVPPRSDVLAHSTFRGKMTKVACGSQASFLQDKIATPHSSGSQLRDWSISGSQGTVFNHWKTNFP